MIKGIGTDIVQVDRVKEKLKTKVLTGKEEFQNPEHFAGIWAGKEAVLKALGCGISTISFKDIEIGYTKAGAPVISLSATAKELLTSLGASAVHISISHEREYAVGMAIIE